MTIEGDFLVFECIRVPVIYGYAWLYESIQPERSAVVMFSVMGRVDVTGDGATLGLAHNLHWC